MRDAGNENNVPYDLEKVKAALLSEGSSSFAFFGGEPLLLPIRDFEEMARWGKAQGKQMSVQTNAALISERHFELFKELGISVGVSMDGPEELNDAREAKERGATKFTTAQSQKNLERLLAEGIPTSLIVTLHRLNAQPHHLKLLIDWLLRLKDLGLKYVNLHPLEVDGEAGRELMLGESDSIFAMRRLRKALEGMYVHPFEDMKGALSGDDGKANCVWHACDPYTTAAVRGLDGNGQLGNCGRTNKDGVVYQKGNKPSHVRQLALYHTPQEYGGCAECRFFVVCRGECPGTGELGDWRSRTAHCSMIKALLSDIEAELAAEGKTPVSLSLDRGRIESAMLRAWELGQSPSITWATNNANTQHGDVAHGDRPHGDKPHGDSHK